MRAYFFGNMYLSSIQQGIQAAHVVAEMYTKYVSPDGCQEYFILEHWAREHKTMVLLNAGYGQEIHSLVEFFSSKDNPLPWAKFHEGVDALDGAITCVGIILPEEFYEAAKELRSPSMGVTTNIEKLQPGWERELATRLNNYGLAK
jgi:hypothetical protein